MIRTRVSVRVKDTVRIRVRVSARVKDTVTGQGQG